MPPLIFPAPAILHGDNLEAELRQALGIAKVDVTRVGAEVMVAVSEAVSEAEIAAVIAAHTGQPTAEQQAEMDADNEAATAFGDLGPLLAKARAVRAGTDTFTASQLQRIVAALVLLAARRLR